MIEDGRLDVDGFVTMSPASSTANPMKALRTAKDVLAAFRGYEDSEVGEEGEARRGVRGIASARHKYAVGLDGTTNPTWSTAFETRNPFAF